MVAKALYTQFLDDDVYFGQVAALSEKCQTVLTRSRTSEFEGWICRIALGGAKTKARNKSKALSGKHSLYIKGDGCDPSTCVFAALWKITLALLESPA